MRPFAKALALSCLGLLLPPLAHAFPSIGTLTCIGNDGSTLTEPLFAFTFDIKSGAPPRFFTAYVPLADLNKLILEQFFGTGYSTCTLTTLPGLTPSAVSIVDSAASGIVGGIQSPSTELYASATFSYNGLTVNSSSLKPTPSATSEQQEKALQEYKTRNFSIPSK